MELLVLLIFQLFLEVQPQTPSGFSQSSLTVSPASVLKESSTTQVNFETTVNAQVSQGTDTLSNQSHFTTHHNKRPNIRYIYDSQLSEFRIYCEIPGSDNAGYNCDLFFGGKNQRFKTTVSHKTAEKTQCIFTVLEYEFLNRLNSVKNKVMSCNYSPIDTTTNYSPHSNKINLTGFLPVPVQSSSTRKGPTLHSTPTFPSITTIDLKKTLVTKSGPCNETTTNPTAETTSLQPLNVTSNSTAETTSLQPLNVTSNSTAETFQSSQQPLNVTWKSTAVPKTVTPGKTTVPGTANIKMWYIMALAVTSGGIVLTGLTGICLCCISAKKPRIKSNVNNSAASHRRDIVMPLISKHISVSGTARPSVEATPQTPDNNEEYVEENGDQVYHVYCTIPDVSVSSHDLYSLAHMPTTRPKNYPLPV